MKIVDFRLRIPVLVALLVLVPAAGEARKRRKPNAELCSLRTVYVDGNSQSATAARHDLEKETWLKLEDDAAKADAVLIIQETRGGSSDSSEYTRVSGEVRQGSKLLWSRSTGGAAAFLSISATAETMELLRHLNKDAACK